MIGLDTNVLVRLHVGDDAAQAAAARTLVETLNHQQPGVITHVTLVEFYWVLRRAYRIPRREVVRAIRRIVDAVNVVVDHESEVRRALEAVTEGADFADALIDTCTRRMGASRIVTFDQRAASALGWELLPG